MIRRLFAAALLAGLGLTQAAQAEAPPIRDFFKTPAVQAPKLSPSGRYLAIQTAGAGGRIRLAVIDLQTMAPGKVVGGFSNADVAEHDWVNEDRLVFQISSPQDGTQRILAPGLWAVNRDGTGFRQLIISDFDAKDGTTSHINDRRLEGNWVFYSTLPDGSDDILVMRRRWSSDPEAVGAQLSRLNSRTGQRRDLNEGLPDYVSSWVTDTRGEPRAVTAHHDGGAKVYLHQPDGRWKLWQDLKSYYDPHPSPFWFGPDGQVLALMSHQDNTSLFRLDPATLAPEPEPLLHLKGFDFDGRLIVDAPTQRLLGVQFETDAPGSAWFNPTMKAMQADIDAKLPSTVNLIECQRCLDAQHIIVTAESDVQPALYFLYKPADKSLQPIAALRPEIKPAEMGQRDFHRIAARDKLDLPVLVTQPAAPAKGPRPAVVLVHGGPWVRGTHWTWEPMAQFLSTRGYVVLEPEFRGSTGYGWKHFRAGWGEWGLSMQDDLADTVTWAVKQGLVDPQCVCIAGASYGGYAALMGAIRQSDIFKCAIDWAGVSDLDLLFSLHWSDASQESRNFGLKQLVGDSKTDAERFKATSPLRRAAEIKLPMLIAHGGDDQRVPVQHATELKGAMRSDQVLEWVVYPDEGHGWRELKTSEDFWGRVERFLARNIGTGAASKP
ncbi:MAG: S9 family peptidase [Burkholderiales bacterium]|jgi:dipeptidyl aminopeptidase/acylaminoacyl peptidase|nr:S9 family peptidase [Burkholderiales bacterium]